MYIFIICIFSVSIEGWRNCKIHNCSHFTNSLLGANIYKLNRINRRSSLASRTRHDLKNSMRNELKACLISMKLTLRESMPSEKECPDKSKYARQELNILGVSDIYLKLFVYLVPLLSDKLATKSRFNVSPTIFQVASSRQIRRRHEQPPI